MEEMRLLPLTHDNEEIGSFFFDELETLQMTESSKKFYILYLDLVDISQTLPLVLVNKKKICQILIDKIEDIYFQPIVGKLLLELYRDCGAELYEETLELILPSLTAKLDIVKIQMV